MFPFCHIERCSRVIEEDWPIAVGVLVIMNAFADVLSRRGRVTEAFVMGVLNVIGWIVLLGTKAPFARSIAMYAILSYVLTALIGTTLFSESLTVTVQVPS